MDDTSKNKKIKAPRKIGFYLLIIGFICIIMAGFLGLQTFGKVGHRPPPVPRETNVSLIQDWMTISHISRVYGVPEPEFFKALNLDSEKYHKSSLKQIANKENINSSQLLDSIRKIINNFQSSHPKPPAN